MRRLRKAVFPVAGLGTRFLPATKAVPKELLPIVDRPLIHYGVEEAVRSGFSDVIFVTSRGKDSITDYFDFDFELANRLRDQGKTDLSKVLEEVSSMASVSSVRQKEPLGLGHAVLVSEPLVGNEPFAVVLCDDLIDHESPCLEQMRRLQETHGGSVLATMEVPPEAVSLYGMVALEGEAIDEEQRLFRVRDTIEKPSREEAPSNLAIIGRYLFTPTVFDLLRATRPGAGGEIQLTDAIRRLIEREPVYSYRFKGRRYDAGNKLEFLLANLSFALKRQDLGPELKKHMAMLDLSQ